MKAFIGLTVSAAIGVTACATAIAQQPQSPLMLFFDWGKPDIRNDDQATLDQAAAAWRANPAARLEISGFADRSGSSHTNLQASKQRAGTVYAELVKRGVPAGAMTLHAYGEQRPLVPTEDGVREVQNRRVEIRVGD